MQCPRCQYPDNRVLESRCTEEGQSVRRRRECLRCRHRFTTYERVEFVPITVVKRDGTKEYFDRSKLLRGIVRACEKTGIDAEILGNLVGEIEAEIEQRLDREINSQEIGILVLQHLRSLSEVAYVRFASVYRQFQSIEDFIEILDRLQKTENQLITVTPPA